MNICWDNEEHLDTLMKHNYKAFLQTQLNEERFLAALWILPVYSQSGIASYAKLKVEEVRRGSGAPKATGESLNCDWVPVKLGPNLIKLLDITPSL